MAVLVSNVPVLASDAPDFEVLRDRLGLGHDHVLGWRLVKKSLDARQKVPVWRGVYRLEVHDEDALLARHRGVRRWTERDDARYGEATVIDPVPRRWEAGHHVVVVGAGPAGLFAALFLAESSARVTLLDRGGPVKDRVKAVNGFWRRKVGLDSENNLLFGEGGAGTFSDGKIYTRRRDGDIGYVLRRFVDFGAKRDILKEGWAHLGTDQVRAMLPRFRSRLAELGVDVRYHCGVTDLVVEAGEVRGVVTSDGTIFGDEVIFAPGHSARDSVRMLVERGAAAVSRPVAIGARIEHPQTVIDEARYGRARETLPPASYRLAHDDGAGLKVRTFCMCPGGIVVHASNQDGRVVVNGMSFAAQRAFWANSAVVVEVEPEAFGHDGPLAGYAWQEEIECRAFELAGSSHAAPAQRVVDFLAGRRSEDLPKTSYPLGITSVDLHDVLPEAVCNGLKRGLQEFERKVPGFAGDQAVLIAPETRTTSPIRFLRDDGGQSTTIRGLYPTGEGAGFGGGIVSCALDGIRAARDIVQRYAVERDS